MVGFRGRFCASLHPSSAGSKTQENPPKMRFFLRELWVLSERFTAATSATLGATVDRGFDRRPAKTRNLSLQGNAQDAGSDPALWRIFPTDWKKISECWGCGCPPKGGPRDCTPPPLASAEPQSHASSAAALELANVSCGAWFEASGLSWQAPVQAEHGAGNAPRATKAQPMLGRGGKRKGPATAKRARPEGISYGVWINPEQQARARHPQRVLSICCSDLRFQRQARALPISNTRPPATAPAPLPQSTWPPERG